MSTVETPSSILGQPEQQAPLEVSVVIPCLNEAESIEQCVRSAIAVLEQHAIAGEIIVADNDSDDDSPRLAAAAGAIVVHEPERGYGSAYLAGFAAARGRYILMADADLTYDFRGDPALPGRARRRRRHGDRQPDEEHPARSDAVASPLHRQPAALGAAQPALPDRRRRCALRHAGVAPGPAPRLDLRTTGMEFASEMVIRAAKEHLEIRQFAIDYHPREGESKLSSFRDGWRHLRFLLVHSPNHLFIFPGAVMALIGFLVELIVLTQIGVFGRQWNIHALIGGALLAIVGTQVVALGICAHAYGTYFMGERDRWFDRMRARYKLEHGLLLGGALLLAGLIVGAVIVIDWIQRGFGVLSEERLAVLAATLIIVGIQIFFSSFLLSILGLRRRR